MKKTSILTLLLMVFVLGMTSCNKYETYAEQKEKEKKVIQNYISEHDIQVLTVDEFVKNGCVTDTAKNEYVLFKDRGVYMQIIRKGEGRTNEDGGALPKGGRGVFMARYYEYNLISEDTISTNLFSTLPDYFTCERDGDTFTATFTKGVMMNIYNSPMVPGGWLVPFSYITPGRPNDKGAKVRLILPHSEGTQMSITYVYPTLYEITYIPES